MGSGKAKPRAEISIAHRGGRVRVPAAALRRLVRFVAEAEGQPLAAVDLAVVGAEEMAELNRRYRRHAGPTDVLSFDLSDDARTGIVAQIVVCGDLAAEQGPPRGLAPQQELQLYVIHGLLHLMGCDDTGVRAAAKMRARQDELLSAFRRRAKAHV